MNSRFAIAFAVVILALPCLAGAATIHVPADQPTIQAGITAAVAGDTVLVACGTYYESNIVMASGITLRSQWGFPYCVTIDAQNQSRVINCSYVDNTARIEGFTIKDDKLPGRLFDPKPDGPEAGKRVFSQTDFHKAVELLYDLIGCDSETGRPQRGKLIELGLEWVDDLLTRSQK